MIIDSSYLFDLMAEDPDAFSKGTELVEKGEMQWLPTPVVAETYYGVATARSETTEQEVRTRLLGYPRIDVDEEIARKAGELLAAADDRVGGNAGVGPNDGYIAAMADVLDDAVLTCSERKPTPSGVGVSDSTAWKTTHYDSSGCSTASNPALMISR